jgi:hypothetical protein
MGSGAMAAQVKNAIFKRLARISARMVQNMM